MKHLLFILFLGLSFSVCAEEIYPAGCKALVVEDEFIVIPADEPRIIMIHNLSNVDLWITHTAPESSASAGWSSRLQAGNWSALAMDKHPFELSCIESRPGHEQQIACANVIGLCQWATSARPEKPTGIFWAGEDMALAPLTAYISRHGFVVPSATQ